MKRLIPLLLAAAAASTALLLSSCGDRPPIGSGLAIYQAYDRPASRPTDPADVRVKVSLSRQRVYVMEGGKLLLVMPVTVGGPSSPTPRGDFRITRKELEHRSRSHGFASDGSDFKRTTPSKKPAGWSFTGSPMPYWCEFKNGYGFHTGWIKHFPNSDGCIRMHENIAPEFFALVREGTPVNISTTQPEDAQYGNIPLPPDAGPLPDYPPEFYVGDGYFTRHKPVSFE